MNETDKNCAENRKPGIIWRLISEHPADAYTAHLEEGKNVLE